MNPIPIQLQDASRSFRGVPVIKNLTLNVQAGSIYGFLGRNAAGKTTALRMLAGLIRPDSGTARILDIDPFSMGAAEREWLGYLPERLAIPPRSKVRAVLNLGRDLYPTWDASLAESLVGKYGLSVEKRFSTLSQGSQRILGFIMAIAPRPKVLLLDEPAANLDVIARREVLDNILTLIRDCGCTVLMSTHILGDVERVADQVGILANGALRVSEPLDTLKDSIRQVRFFGFSGALPTAGIPQSFRTVRGKDEIVMTLRTNSGVTPESLAARWSCRQETRILGLEDIFVELSSN